MYACACILYTLVRVRYYLYAAVCKLYVHSSPAGVKSESPRFALSLERQLIKSPFVNRADYCRSITTTASNGKREKKVKPRASSLDEKLYCYNVCIVFGRYSLLLCSTTDARCTGKRTSRDDATTRYQNILLFIVFYVTTMRPRTRHFISREH